MFDIDQIRKDFKMYDNHPDLVYLDNAATTFKPNQVIKTVVNYYEKYSVNIHRGDYDISQEISNKFDDVRSIVKDFINANNSNEIVFTSGASESLNLVAYGYGKKFLKENDIVLTTEAEHSSNILPWFKVCDEVKAKVKYIPLNSDGSFNLDNLKKVMNENVKVVTLANVTNVLGYILPIKEITAIAHKYNAIVVCDGAQSVPHIKTDVQDMDVDFLAFSSHKLLGPTGAGVLYGKEYLLDNMDTYMLGGGSNLRYDTCGNILLKKPPLKFEAGTPAIEAILGMGEAIKYIQNIGIENINIYEKKLHEYMISKLKSLDNIIIYNENADTGIVSFNVKDIFAQDVGAYLNKYNIAVRSGNHCAKILMEVLKIQYTIRASLYFYNTYHDIDCFIEALSKITIEECIDIVV